MTGQASSKRRRCQDLRLQSLSARSSPQSPSDEDRIDAIEGSKGLGMLMRSVPSKASLNEGRWRAHWDEDAAPVPKRPATRAIAAMKPPSLGQLQRFGSGNHNASGGVTADGGLQALNAEQCTAMPSRSFGVLELLSGDEPPSPLATPSPPLVFERGSPEVGSSPAPPSSPPTPSPTQWPEGFPKPPLKPWVFPVALTPLAATASFSVSTTTPPRSPAGVDPVALQPEAQTEVPAACNLSEADAQSGPSSPIPCSPLDVSVDASSQPLDARRKGIAGSRLLAKLLSVGTPASGRSDFDAKEEPVGEPETSPQDEGSPKSEQAKEKVPVRQKLMMTRSRTRIARLEAAEAKLELFDYATATSSGSQKACSSKTAFQRTNSNQEPPPVDLPPAPDLPPLEREHARPTGEFSGAMEEAASWVSTADVLLVFTGSNFGPDSNLSSLDENGNGSWEGLAEHGGMTYEKISKPQWFQDDPGLAWSFWDFYHKSYSSTAPHAGYGIVQRWARSAPFGSYVFTSNIDSTWLTAGCAEDRLVEIHGSLRYLQCAKPCSKRCWASPSGFGMKAKRAKHHRMNGKLPMCRWCGNAARPNIKMCNSDKDFSKEHLLYQIDRYEEWLQSLESRLQKEFVKLVCLDMGCGPVAATVKNHIQVLLTRFPGARVVRINPECPELDGEELGRGVGLKLPVLEALQRVDVELQRRAKWKRCRFVLRDHDSGVAMVDAPENSTTLHLLHRLEHLGTQVMFRDVHGSWDEKNTPPVLFCSQKERPEVSSLVLPVPAKFFIRLGTEAAMDGPRTMACIRIIHAQFKPKITSKAQTALDWSRALLKDLLTTMESPDYQAEVANQRDRRGVAALVRRIQEDVFPTYGLTPDAQGLRDFESSLWVYGSCAPDVSELLEKTAQVSKLRLIGHLPWTSKAAQEERLRAEREAREAKRIVLEERSDAENESVKEENLKQESEDKESTSADGNDPRSKGKRRTSAEQRVDGQPRNKKAKTESKKTQPSTPIVDSPSDKQPARRASKAKKKAKSLVVPQETEADDSDTKAREEITTPEGDADLAETPKEEEISEDAAKVAVVPKARRNSAKSKGSTANGVANGVVANGVSSPRPKTNRGKPRSRT